MEPIDGMFLVKLGNMLERYDAVVVHALQHLLEFCPLLARLSLWL